LLLSLLLHHHLLLLHLRVHHLLLLHHLLLGVHLLHHGLHVLVLGLLVVHHGGDGGVCVHCLTSLLALLHLLLHLRLLLLHAFSLLFSELLVTQFLFFGIFSFFFGFKFFFLFLFVFIHFVLDAAAANGCTDTTGKKGTAGEADGTSNNGTDRTAAHASSLLLNCVLSGLFLDRVLSCIFFFVSGCYKFVSVSLLHDDLFVLFNLGLDLDLLGFFLNDVVVQVRDDGLSSNNESFNSCVLITGFALLAAVLSLLDQIGKLGFLLLLLFSNVPLGLVLVLEKFVELCANERIIIKLLLAGCVTVLNGLDAVLLLLEEFVLKDFVGGDLVRVESLEILKIFSQVLFTLLLTFSSGRHLFDEGGFVLLDENLVANGLQLLLLSEYDNLEHLVLG